jgi:hypothetical protein
MRHFGASASHTLGLVEELITHPSISVPAIPSSVEIKDLLERQFSTGR